MAKAKKEVKKPTPKIKAVKKPTIQKAARKTSSPKVSAIKKRNSTSSSKTKQQPKELPSPKLKGKRGKKRCLACDSFVPIHCQKCNECDHPFEMKHKPKKEKLPFMGSTSYSFDRSELDVPQLQKSKDTSVHVILGKNKVFGESPYLANSKQTQQRKSSSARKDNNSDSDSDECPTQLYPQRVMQVLSQNFIRKSKEGHFFNQWFKKSNLNTIFDQDLPSIIPIKTEESKAQHKVQEIRIANTVLNISKTNKLYQSNGIDFIAFGQNQHIMKVESLSLSEKHQYCLVSLKSSDELYSLALVSMTYKGKQLPKILWNQQLNGKLTDFDLIKLKQIDSKSNNYIIALCVIDGELILNKITTEKISQVKKYEVMKHGYSPLCLVRCLPYSDMNLAAVSDFDCNIHIIDLRMTCLESIDKLNPCFTIYASHSRLVSDMQFITVPLPEQNGNRAMTYLATCGFDGYFKIWDLQDNFRPIYDYFRSKKWLYQMEYDPTTLSLYCNGEGKHFPQKIFYFSVNRVTARTYNFFTENVTRTCTVQKGDYVFSSSINGNVYRLSKQDISRHLVKQKEKLKNKQVQKVAGFKRTVTNESTFIDITFQEPVADGDENYLYKENESAITCLTVLPPPVGSTEEALIVTALRSSNILFMIKQSHI